MDEQRALKLLQRGDETAIMWFIDRYAAYVNTILYNIIGTSASCADREELSADVFFTLWNNSQKVQSGKVKAYLGAVARNKAKEHRRKINPELPLEEDMLLIAKDDPERGLEEKEQARILREALLTMGQPEREIFFRHYYYFQPVAVIAEEMEINPSTVKTKLHRGRKKLKEFLCKGGFTLEN
ncbi:MAG: sigma-70 family RNA polymerase sigma factor [Oscillospiraceae bacterium]|nr:sigma-70 family RNA polymerase sigma factor [Oscillospiraceae bacterium]